MNAYNPSLRVLIMAAGQGTRMKSSLPKVLHAIAGLPMLHHIMQAVSTLHPDRVGLITRPDQDEIRASVRQTFGHMPLDFFIQDEAKGTGHAVMCASDFYQSEGRTLILCGDTPLIDPVTLKRLCEHHQTPLALIGMRADASRGYGLCLQDAQGTIKRIVEAKEASGLALPSEGALYNAGVYSVDHRILRDILPHIKASALTGEWYLTDLIHHAYEAGHRCQWIEADETQFLGVNSRVDLAVAEYHMQQRLRQRAMHQGVTLVDPASVFLSYDTQIQEDVWIGPSVFCGPGVTIQRGARILGYCVIQEAVIGASSQVGPFAHLRPGTILHDHVKIGNFVELKQTTMAPYAKANHLSYLGDATVGQRANIGAGTITCNYDGVAKHQTHIGADVMVGSNTALVAPVHLGDKAYIGAGSVITQDVPAEDLAIARAQQRNLTGRARLMRSKK